MKRPTTIQRRFIGLTFFVLLAFFANLGFGSVDIPLTDTLGSLMGLPDKNPVHSYIVLEYRLPKAITAVLVGSALAVSGLIMQTLFRNALAGPYVLGISSGASLGAALFIMGSGFLVGGSTATLVSSIGLSIAASLGSILVLLVVILVAGRIKDTMALLIVGLMFGSITGALVSVLAFFSDAEALRKFVFWSYGSVGNLNTDQILLLFLVLCLGLVLVLASMKGLNAFLLGEAYAQSMGVHIKKTKYSILIAAGILAGVVTSLAGPIAFVGLAVPHMARQWFKTTDHRKLLPAVILGGALVVLVCDGIAQLPGTAKVLPLNAVTSIFGAPVVIWLLIKRQKMFF